MKGNNAEKKPKAEKKAKAEKPAEEPVFVNKTPKGQKKGSEDDSLLISRFV